MKLSQEEKAARRAAFQDMSRKKQLEHIFIYYKLPILLGLIAIVILCSMLHRQLTKKDPVLYLGMINVSGGEELIRALGDDYIRFSGADSKRTEVYLYQDLYLSENADIENHEYAYASRMKLMGAVSSGRLDLLLMNREGYDLLSRSAYLADLDALLSEKDPRLRDRLQACLTSNEVILSDNSIDYQLGVAESQETVTESVVNGFDLSQLPLIRRFGFSDPVYLAVIANSGRTEECIRYMKYLAEDP